MLGVFFMYLMLIQKQAFWGFVSSNVNRKEFENLSYFFFLPHRPLDFPPDVESHRVICMNQKHVLSLHTLQRAASLQTQHI